MHVERLHEIMNVKVKARGYYMSLLFFTQNLVHRKLEEDINLRTSGGVPPFLSFGSSEMMMVMMMMMVVT